MSLLSSVKNRRETEESYEPHSHPNHQSRSLEKSWAKSLGINLVSYRHLYKCNSRYEKCSEEHAQHQSQDFQNAKENVARITKHFKRAMRKNKTTLGANAYMYDMYVGGREVSEAMMVNRQLKHADICPWKFSSKTSCWASMHSTLRSVEM